ncbi:hypothetical protein GU927_014060 [Rhodobacteraceae bacterium HSP-20]|uniref:Uncharacterized protein n=1 Tax=Paragemmobacter amnigenus TaxID=2852097 RepID=A0ABS6J6X6_9RHOB|nr:hypothetical protein [Rhodobacter amnigenus]MBU9698971.1 hypothetical protein [Rhodobacter amnigenus]MBV4390198.1 hypothetical protein [Rhodobacter amnigenus]
MDNPLNTLIGVHLDPGILAPTVAWRQGEAEFSPACLGIAGGQTPLAQEVERVLRHCPLQPQEQPIIHQVGVVNAFGVNHQGPGQGAKIDQIMPITAIAGQSGSLNAVDSPY